VRRVIIFLHHVVEKFGLAASSTYHSTQSVGFAESTQQSGGTKARCCRQPILALIGKSSAIIIKPFSIPVC
jgi:hypothetical protein